ncbi:MAG TPA: hypothetical protein VND66_05770 [Acidobacteriaceae bacterium]|nr:hypothetical protein [Terriglobia bacterium]HVC90114.1 hypothetical protein [Acidobacteriaceae bacterium]
MMDDLHDTLARLIATVEILERRVDALEHPLQIQRSIPVPAAISSESVQAASTLPFQQGDGVFSVVGKAMLGIAGAYLLRAVAESTTLPRSVVVAIAIAYAALWLVAATRVRAEAWFASVTYAATSFLIIVAMLWELTLRFKVLPTAVTAGILGAFVVAAYALAWKRHFVAVVWVATAAGCTAALVLSIATHDLAPFIMALLATAIASEYAAASNHSVRTRLLVAASADIATWALIYICSRPEGARVEYKEVSGGLLLALGPVLLLIYGSSATVQTMLLRRRITFFEAAQTLVAFLLTSWSVLVFWSGAGATVLGALCFISAVTGYAMVFICFGAASQQRNYHVYAAGSAALFLAGAYLCLSPVWLVLCLGLAAIAATIVGVQTDRLTLEFHGLAFLAASAFSSGLPVFVVRAFAATFPSSPTWLVWFVSACAGLCYAVERRLQAKQWKHRLLYILSATFAVSAMTALLVWATARLAAVSMIPGASHIAVIRTLTTCLIALGLAYSGSRWRWTELGWLAYGTLVFIASKLLFEDLRQGRLEFTAASIFLYAITLLSVPRIMRLGQKARMTGPSATLPEP